MMTDEKKPGVVVADPSLWSAASQRTTSFHYTREYRDIPYVCWRCKSETVFTAKDQQYTYEVRKAPIDQRRILCTDCWRQLLVIDGEIKSSQARWALDKRVLAADKAFLSRWLELLVSREAYVPYHQDIAAKNMLQKLLHGLG